MSNDDALYHYTTISGFLGILRDRHIWSTDVRFLNDSTELKLGIDALREAVEVAEYPDPDQHWDFIPGMIESKFRQGSLLGVTCFTEDGDELSQWRGYSKVGQGIALRFDRSALIDLAKQRGFSLVKCDYNMQDLKQPVSQWLAKIQGAVLKGVDYADVLAGYHTAELMTIAATFKDPAFEREQEWRLISPPYGAISRTVGDYRHPMPAPEEIGFRAGDFTAIPYLRFPIMNEEGRCVITGAVVGPTREPEPALAAVRMALRGVGIFDVDFERGGEPLVIASKIPYRSM